MSIQLEIWQFFVDLFKNGDFLYVMLLFPVVVILNYKKIRDFNEERKRDRINKIKEALDSGCVTSVTEKFLKSEIENEYFLLTNEFYLEKQFREKVIELHEASDGEIPFFHFKRAMRHLEFAGGAVKVNISKYANYNSWMNYITSVLFFLASVCCFALPLALIVSGKPMPIIQTIVYFLFGFFMLFMFVLMLKETLPLHSARKIEGLLDKVSKNDMKGIED